MQALTLREGLNAFISSSNPVAFKWNGSGSKGFGTLYQQVATWLNTKPVKQEYLNGFYNRWDLTYKNQRLTLLVNGFNAIILRNMDQPAQGTLL